jgi:hypothetical protein
MPLRRSSGLSLDIYLNKTLPALSVIVLLLTAVGCRQGGNQQIALRSEINASDTLQLKALEGTGIFSDGWVGEHATVLLSNPKHERGLLISGTNVQTGLKDEKLFLTLEYDDGSSDSVDVAEPGNFEHICLLSADVAAKDTLRINLVSSKVFVPSRLGTSADDRSLSFRLAKITLIGASAVEEKLPSSFKFPREPEHDPNLVGIYKDGWFADSARITLRNQQKKRTVEIRGFFPPDIFTKIATLEVYDGQELLVKEQLPRRDSGYFRFLVQLPERPQNSSSVTLTLHASGAFIPAERKTSSDERRLSYRLEYIGMR